MKKISKKESLGFSVFVDEEINELFHIFFAMYVAFQDDVPDGTDGFMTRECRNDKFKKFVEAVSGPEHKLKWCVDPECSYEESQTK